MKSSNYKPRIVDSQIKNALSTFGAVCVEGPKWCGKTWTSDFHAKSKIELGDHGYTESLSLARNESTTATNKILKNDIKEVDDDDIDTDTIASYLDVLKRLFLVENQPPFSTKIRSKLRVKQAEKRHLADPSLAASLLGATPDKLIHDLNTLGFLFESLCERDLDIYAKSFDGKLCHYQDYANKEIDSVIEMPDGSWSAFEIKLGANQIDEAARNLLDIQRDISNDPKGIPPSNLCVICGMSSAAYKRPDGVFVVPITALKN